MISNDGAVKFHQFMRSLLCNTACKVRPDFVRGSGSYFISAKHIAQKQGVSEKCVVEPAASRVICGENEIFL